MFSFLSAIPVIGKLFDTVGSITNRLTDARIALTNAQTERERIRWQAEVSMLEAKLTGLQASINSPLGWTVVLLQSLFGFAVLVLVVKLAVYDKAFGQWTHGHTDALGKDLWDLIKIVTGFYFVTTWFRA